jgi:hypothetical protein
VLGHLEGRLDKVTAVIRQVAVQGKALELAVPEEDEDGADSGESSGELEIPALQSNMEEQRIVDIQEPAPGPSKPEEPHEDPNPSPSSVKKGDRREDGEVWPSLEEQRRRAEEEYDKLGGLSHGCRQSWDLRMREEKGPGRKINGLFHWISEDSLILHEVARAAGLEGRGSAWRVNSLRMKDMESTCAYCVPLTDWKGEVKYLWARGVDYIAQLPGSEDPRRWYDRFPGLVEARYAEAEEKAPIEMMIAKDNWKWMPVQQASRLTERQDDTKTKDRKEAFGPNSVRKKTATPPMRGGRRGYSSGGRGRGWVHQERGQQGSHGHHKNAGPKGEGGRAMDRAQGVRILWAGRGTLPKGREQKKFRGLAVKAQGDG